jgi:hypothetical protein
VRFLPLSELAKRWAPELRESVDTIESELKLFVINKRRAEDGKGPVSRPPPSHRLPLSSELVAREDLPEFCAKQGRHWNLPRFWSEGDEEVLRRGRPSPMPAIVQEFERRSEAGALENTLADQARALRKWAEEHLEQLRGVPVPTSEAIANRIRSAFREAKRAIETH